VGGLYPGAGGRPIYRCAGRGEQGSQRESKLGFSEAVGIGLAQAALVLGVSRSGATITLGLFLGLRREEAARFSFLMSVPIIAGAGYLQLAEVVSQGRDAWERSYSARVSSPRRWFGYLTIKFFLRFVAHHSLHPFAYYRFGLAVVVVALLLFQRLQIFDSGGGLLVLWRRHARCGFGVRTIYRGEVRQARRRGYAPLTLNATETP
jgi:hypothetical protein